MNILQRPFPPFISKAPYRIDAHFFLLLQRHSFFHKIDCTPHSDFRTPLDSTEIRISNKLVNFIPLETL